MTEMSARAALPQVATLGAPTIDFLLGIHKYAERPLKDYLRLCSNPTWAETALDVLQACAQKEILKCGIGRLTFASPRVMLPDLLLAYWRDVMSEADKRTTASKERRASKEPEERKLQVFEEIARTLAKMHHELIQLRVQVANINVSLMRKR
jgi:hypothetical protein